MKRTEYRENKWIFPFVSYSPENKGTKLPVIIQLHGAGGRGAGKEDLKAVDVNGLSQYLETNEHECFFVMPQCPVDSFWVAKIESLLKFIEQLISEFDLDEDRVYLTGLSMGGFGTWYTAMAKPDMFAAIAPICGGGMAWNAGALTMPVWAFHGANDPIVSPMQTEEMIASLKITNDDVKYTKYEGVGHDSWVLAYNKELVEWLLSKKRKH